MAKNNNIVKESMLRTGMILHSNYRIDGYLSSGGFGNTYVATHVQFNEKRAIKEFFMKGVSERDANNSTVRVSNTNNVAEFEEQRSKFKKEAQRLHNLNNDHIVKVYDLFDENGTSYYVMDYIEGENLKERLERTRDPMKESEVLDVLRQVLDALQQVHSQGLWHLDLKPANVMMDGNGVVKLIDFGASKQFDHGKGGAMSTSAVTFTSGYAPIEQMDSHYGKFGPWTDFYALGATLYNLLTGKKPPMASDIVDDVTPDKHIALPMPGKVSDTMRNLVLWLMQPNRVKRPQSVDQIMSYLDNPSAGIPLTAGEDSEDEKTRIGGGGKLPPVNPPKEPKPKKKNKGLMIGMIAAALIAMPLVGILSYKMIYKGDAVAPVDSVAATNAATVTQTPAPVEADSTVENMKMVLPLGECVYTGGIDKNGRPQGKGTAVFSNGDRCEGTFVNGNLSGTDISYYFFDGYTFVGVMENNSFIEGRYTKPSGDYFEGKFSDNLPDENKGSWYNPKGSPKQRTSQSDNFAPK